MFRGLIYNNINCNTVIGAEANTNVTQFHITQRIYFSGMLLDIVGGKQ